MNPISLTYTTTGAKDGISLDWRIDPAQVSWMVYVPGGTTVSATLDHTYDNILDSSITPVWISSPAITATAEGTFRTPYQFVRLNIASISGGSVTLKLLQAAQIGTV